jgi:hypothetical protein
MFTGISLLSALMMLIIIIDVARYRLYGMSVHKDDDEVKPTTKVVLQRGQLKKATSSKSRSSETSSSDSDKDKYERTSWTYSIYEHFFLPSANRNYYVSIVHMIESIMYFVCYVWSIVGIFYIYLYSSLSVCETGAWNRLSIIVQYTFYYMTSMMALYLLMGIFVYDVPNSKYIPPSKLASVRKRERNLVGINTPLKKSSSQGGVSDTSSSDSDDDDVVKTTKQNESESSSSSSSSSSSDDDDDEEDEEEQTPKKKKNNR